MKVALLLVLSLLSLVPARAQQARPLASVRTIYIQSLPGDPQAMNIALIQQLQESGVFEVVLNRTDPADSVLVPLYGCDTRTGEYLPEKERKTKRGLCSVTLIDSAAEDVDGNPVRIWDSRSWRIPEFYYEVEMRRESGQFVDVAKSVAGGVVAELLADRLSALEGKPLTPIQTLTLGQVKTIFVSGGDYSYETAADKFMEDLMQRQLAKWIEVKEKGKRKYTMVGDGWVGVESVLPGVRLVFNLTQADAILIGPYTQAHAGPVVYTGTGHATTTINSDGTTAETSVQVAVREHQRVVEAGTTVLFDRRTGETIWKATKNDYQWWVGVLAGGSNTGPVTVVEKLAKQLKKDYEKAVRER